jgi:hypothetical protein
MQVQYPGKAAGPCWHCVRYVALIAQGSAAICGRGAQLANAADSAQHLSVRSMPDFGCAFFMREVGSDDEPDRAPTALTVQQADALVHRLRRTGCQDPGAGHRKVQAGHQNVKTTPPMAANHVARPQGVRSQS